MMEPPLSINGLLRSSRFIIEPGKQNKSREQLSPNLLISAQRLLNLLSSVPNIKFVLFFKTFNYPVLNYPACAPRVDKTMIFLR